MIRSQEITISSAGVAFQYEPSASETLISFHVSGTFVATVAIEVSNNGTLWTPVQGAGPGTGGSATAANITAAGIYVYPVQTRYIRANVTSYTSGTAFVLMSAGQGALNLPGTGGGGGGLTDAQLRASRVPVNASIPQASSVSVVSASAAATFALFPSTACTALSVVNNSGTSIEVQRGGAGSTIPLLSGQSYLFVGITNANQLGIRRVDLSATAVTITAEAITV